MKLNELSPHCQEVVTPNGMCLFSYDMLVAVLADKLYFLSGENRDRQGTKRAKVSNTTSRHIAAWKAGFHPTSLMPASQGDLIVKAQEVEAW